MTDRVGDDGQTPPLSPHQEKKMYEAEYKQAADLFKNTLAAYEKSDNKYQKAEFKKVMEESLQVLNDAATGLRRNDLLNQNSQIEKDYTDFQMNDTNDTKLQKDLDKAKRSV